LLIYTAKNEKQSYDIPSKVIKVVFSSKYNSPYKLTLDNGYAWINLCIYTNLAKRNIPSKYGTKIAAPPIKNKLIQNQSSDKFYSNKYYFFVDSQTHGSITTYLLAQISNGGSLTTLALHHKLLSIYNK